MCERSVEKRFEWRMIEQYGFDVWSNLPLDVRLEICVVKLATLSACDDLSRCVELNEIRGSAKPRGAQGNPKNCE
jgi:hypothetical protein